MRKLYTSERASVEMGYFYGVFLVVQILFIFLYPFQVLILQLLLLYMYAAHNILYQVDKREHAYVVSLLFISYMVLNLFGYLPKMY